MKHLKKFNEELKEDTYIQAAKKLKKLGHEERSKRILKNLEIIKWKENLNRFSSLGKATVDISGRGFHEKLNINIGISFESIGTEDSILEAIEGNSENVVFFFQWIIIPADNESLEKIYKLYPNDFYNGFYWGSNVIFSYSVDGGKLLNPTIEIDKPEDILINIDRRIAYLIKKHLLMCFEEGNYYSGYTDEVNMFKKIRKTLTNTNFTFEFNYTMKDIYDDINQISINTLYSE